MRCYNLSGPLDGLVKSCAVALASAVFVVGCPPPAAPCDEQKAKAQIHALEKLHEAAALGVIAAGKCDAYKGKPVETCPAYAAIEADFRLTASAVCR